MKQLFNTCARLTAAALNITALLAALILAGCTPLMDIFSKPETAEEESQRPLLPGGYAVVKIAGNDNRTLMPTMIGAADVSKYVVTVTKDGETITWTADDAAEKTELVGSGHTFELTKGVWTIAVDAYRWHDLNKDTIQDTGEEYKAASGTASLTVTTYGSNTAFVTLNEIARDDWEGLKGIFRWNLTLPEGVAVNTAKLGAANLDGTSGSIEAGAGIYDFSLILTETATGMSAGVYETVYVFPGLETPAIFDFTVEPYTLTFAENIPVSGTLDTVTGPGVNPVGTEFTISAYSDAECATAISIVPAVVNADWTWTVFVPAKPSQTAYFKAGSTLWQLESAGVSSAVTLGPEIKTGVPVPAPVISTLDGSVTIAGSALVAGTLTALTDGLTVQGAAFHYQWKAGGSSVGTDSAEYTIAHTDFGKTITVTVTSSGAVGSVTSGASEAVDAASLEIRPRADQETYVGGAPIRYSAHALGIDGSVIEEAADVITLSGGVDSGGLFTPTTAGTYTITAGLGDKSAQSGTLTVHGADYLRQPYTYPGTGVTYNGYNGTEVSESITGGVTITYPAVSGTSFSADGFFTLEGTVDNPSVYNYALIYITKGDLTTSYWVRGSFKTRIWLRFGPGAYTVSVKRLHSITVDLNGEGDLLAWSYYNTDFSYTVTNTHDDGAGNDVEDRRFLYPSYVVQSDDFLVTNLARELTYNLTDPVDKIRAIHDYLVKNTVYDDDSLIDGERKKQDALTVLGTRYHIDSQYEPAGHYLAVCEGYANASAALLRAAGFETKYQSSSAMNHGWNHVYVDGAWKFYDATWDDPGRAGVFADMGPAYTRYKYFLLTSLTGVDGDHYDDTTDNRRFVMPSAKPPRMRGVPDGWY